MQTKPYDRQLDDLIASLDPARPPRLLLHACCAPCSSAVLERLADHFRITVFYYNPNIATEAEYRHREEEVRRLIALIPQRNPIDFLSVGWEPEEFRRIARGYEDAPEGGERCFRCYELRLARTAAAAKAGGYDWFATTLSISPLKNADRLNEIGERVGAEWGVAHLPSNFKKKGGYQRSVELSREYGLYRQDFCGCVYSLRHDWDRHAAAGAGPENAAGARRKTEEG